MHRHYSYPVSLILAFTLVLSGTAAAQVTVTRLLDQPIITPDLHPSLGVNIQGPSLIRAPDWLPGRLGNYYLYFADHKGQYIRLAYADRLTGPWQVHVPGSLQISESHFAVDRPPLSDADFERMAADRRARGVQVSHDLRMELTEPHIASPDVHVDESNRRILMYYHGLEAAGQQHSRVALSGDGIHFTAREANLGRSYMRIFEYDGTTYALAMPGQLYRSRNGLDDFEAGPRLFNPDMRHAAVLVRGHTLYVFWTQVGHAPESILLSTIDLRGDWSQWQETEPQLVLSPERDWEGALAPVEPSVRSTAYGQVNQLRDPALYVENDQVYLLYAVAGESGIAIATVDFHD